MKPYMVRPERRRVDLAGESPDRVSAEALVNRYGWPGNVRELENALHYCAMACNGGVIDIDDFPEAVRRGASAHMGDQGTAAAKARVHESIERPSLEETCDPV